MIYYMQRVVGLSANRRFANPEYVAAIVQLFTRKVFYLQLSLRRGFMNFRGFQHSLHDFGEPLTKNTRLSRVGFGPTDSISARLGLLVSISAIDDTVDNT